MLWYVPVLNRAGTGSGSPNWLSLTGFSGSVTSQIDIPSVLGVAELHASLLWSRMSPVNDGVSTCMMWRPSPGYSFELAGRNPTTCGSVGSLTSTTWTPPPFGQFGAHALRYAYPSKYPTSAMPLSTFVSSSLPTSSTLLCVGGRWPVSGPC